MTRFLNVGVFKSLKYARMMQSNERNKLLCLLRHRLKTFAVWIHSQEESVQDRLIIRNCCKDKAESGCFREVFPKRSCTVYMLTILFLLTAFELKDDVWLKHWLLFLHCVLCLSVLTTFKPIGKGWNTKIKTYIYIYIYCPTSFSRHFPEVDTFQGLNLPLP